MSKPSKRRKLPSFSRKATPTKLIEHAPETRQKVLIVAHNHPGFFPGGGEIFAYRMFEELKKHKRYEPIFLAATGSHNREPHPGTPFLSYEGRKDEYLFWGDAFDYFQQSLRESTFLFRDFAKFLEQHKPEVIHFHHTLRFGVEAIQIARQVLPEVRIVYTLHDFIPMCHRDGQMVRTKNNELCDRATPARCHECFPEISPALFKTRELFIKTHFRLVDMLISPSTFLAERFIQWGIPADKMRVIENGMPALAEATPRYPSGSIFRSATRHRFGYFGQISPYKGTLQLLEAVEILRNEGHKDLHVNIHGNIAFQTDEFKQRFHAQIAAMAPAVQFHDVYDSREIGRLMRDVDWVVVPSIWWENSPLVIAEAKQHGRPVICADIGGMAEKIQPEVNGLHFRARNTHDLAQTMRRAMTEKGLWEQLSSGISAPMSIAECVRQYVQTYAHEGAPSFQTASATAADMPRRRQGG